MNSKSRRSTSAALGEGRPQAPRPREERGVPQAPRETVGESVGVARRDSRELREVLLILSDACDACAAPL